MGSEVENVYKPDPTDFTPKTTKTIKVEFGPTVAEKIFNFDLKLESAVAKDGTTDVMDGASLQSETKTITVRAGETVGATLFSKITFSKAGTYTYSITEQVSGEEGITDDNTPKTLEIIVTDKDGALYIEKYTYSTGETHSAGPNDTPLTGLEDGLVGSEVENVYKPDDVVVEIEGQKLIQGDTQKDMVFTFTLVPVSMVLPAEAIASGVCPTVPMPATDTVTVTGSGKFAFGKIKYEVAGVYTYKVFEKVENYVGYTFDDSIYDVTVTITDMDGYLTSKVEYALSDAAAKLALFTNIFETASLTVTKTVTTTVVNGDPQYEFTVELFDENGNHLYGVYPITGSIKGKVVNGKATFMLGHNQNAVISDIPIGTYYKVTEKLDEETYTTTFVNRDGTIVREGNISNWYNKPKSVVPNFGGLWINVGDCFE